MAMITIRRCPRPTSPSVAVALGLVLSLSLAACGSGTTQFGGSGGSGGAGRAGAGGSTTGGAGTTGEAGVTGGAGTTGAGGTAGATGTGGTSASGGGTGLAGAKGTAGAPGPGGTSGKAGASGSAGVKGAAGVTGTAGATGAGGVSGRVPMKHRGAEIACSPDRAASTCPAASTPDAGVSLMCTRDTDCTAGTNGRCDPTPRINGCQCSYDQCFADADCKTTGGPCECRPLAVNQAIVAPTVTATNTCKAGNCRVDKDCGADGYCSPSLGPCGNYAGVLGYYCHTPQDKCVDDADCKTQGGGDCRFNAVGAAWECQTSQCAG